MSELRSVHVLPSEVHKRLSEHLLVDGYRLVLDEERSHGSWLVDARDGREYLDLYTQFASAPLGANPPGIVDDPAFMVLLAGVAAGKPANPDMYTTHLAEFVEGIRRCRTCSSWRGALWRSRTRSRRPSTGRVAATRQRAVPGISAPR